VQDKRSGKTAETFFMNPPRSRSDIENFDR
jgi:hypothetical protein